MESLIFGTRYKNTDNVTAYVNIGRGAHSQLLSTWTDLAYDQPLVSWQLLELLDQKVQLMI